MKNTPLKLKLDEHLGLTSVRLLTRLGHDAVTVRDQGLQGTPDERLLPIVAAEGRTLVTLDRGFANFHVFQPGTHAGIVVLRPSRQSPARVAAMLERLLTSELANRLEGAVVIVRENGVRFFPAETQP